MKKFIAAIFALCISACASAGTTWSLQGMPYDVDTLYHATIGPGTTQTSLSLGGTQNLKIFYLTVDLTHPYVDLRVTKAGGKPAACQTVTAQGVGTSHPGAKYFAGVNADFFANQAPCGSTVVDGTIVGAVNNTFPNFYVTDAKVPAIANLQFGGTITAGANTHALNGINIYRGENQIILYTPYQGATTGTNTYGAEVALEPVAGTLDFNGTITCRVTTEPSTQGNTAIPASGYVLAGHGTGKAFVQGLTPGQEISIKTKAAQPYAGRIMQMASGCPIILSKGQVLETQNALDHLTALNPRTAVGIDASGTKVVMLVVDGRGMGGSAGVVSKVLADIMACTGCSEALNFDGGGSSCLYTEPLGVRNLPSDGKERAVTNALFAVATGQDDNEIAEIRFDAPHIHLPHYGYFSPTIYAYNKYGVLLDTDLTGFELSCPEALGQPVENGSLLFANGHGTHALTASYNGITCRVPVTISESEPSALYQKVVIDKFKPYTAEVVAQVNGRTMPLANQALDWSTSDAAVARVDDDGTVKAQANGTAEITGRNGDFSTSFTVTVQHPVDRAMALSSLSASDWTISGGGTGSRTLANTPEGALNLVYNITSTRGPYLSLRPAATTSFYGLPDSVMVCLDPSETQITKIIINAGSDERGTAVTLTPTLVPNTTNTILVPVHDFIDTDRRGNYPLLFNSMQIYVAGATKTDYSMSIKAINGIYTGIEPGQGIENINPDCNILTLLNQNVVAVGSTVQMNCGTHSHYCVQTLGGQTVITGRGNILTTSSLAPGLYIVSASGFTPAKLLVR